MLRLRPNIGHEFELPCYRHRSLLLRAIARWRFLAINLTIHYRKDDILPPGVGAPLLI